MKNFNLDKTIIAFSDDEKYAAIRATDYIVGVSRTATYSWKMGYLQQNIANYLGACERTPIVSVKERILKEDLVPVDGCLMVCIVKTDELRMKAPEYFRPSDNELLLALTTAQREDSPFMYPEHLDYAKNLWSGAVALKVDLSRKHDIGVDNNPNIYCEKDVFMDPEPLIKDRPALKRLKERIKNAPVHVNNSSLTAGSPMYFYCKLCMHLSDTKPESYTTPVKKYCDVCQELKEANPGLTDETILEHAAGM